jgi:hypothetical protein
VCVIPTFLIGNRRNLGSSPLTKPESARLNRYLDHAGDPRVRHRGVGWLGNSTDIAAHFRKVVAVYAVLTMMGKDCSRIG